MQLGGSENWVYGVPLTWPFQQYADQKWNLGVSYFQTNPFELCALII